MARFSKIHPEVDAIYDCAHNFWISCILKDGSLFFDENIWSLESLQKIYEDFVLNPDERDLRFRLKFKDQIGNSGKAITRLGGELLAVYYLFPTTPNKGVKNVWRYVEEVLDWNGDSVPHSHPVAQAMKYGIGGTGPGYFRFQYLEVAFLIRVALDVKKLSSEQRNLLNDPWKFQEFIDSVEGAASRQGRHTLLHLLFPDHFERIATTRDKESISYFFSKYADPAMENLDQRLYSIRRSLQAESPDNDVDFYRSPWLEMWPKDSNKASLLVPFKNWLATEKYADSTIYAYSKALRLAPAKLEQIAISPTNLLLCSNLEELQDIYDKIRKAPNFDAIDQKEASKAFSAAMTQYEKFLGLIDKQDLPSSLASLPLSVEDKYRIWMVISDRWVENTVAQCISSLKNTASKLEGFTDIDPNLFRSTSLSQFASLYDSFRNAPNFAAENKKAGNGSFARGLDTYKEFLEAMGPLLSKKDNQGTMASPLPAEPSAQSYGVDDIVDEGCFLSRDELSTILERLQDKKNLILQGPPGTGKTWLAKRLAYALVGSKDTECIRPVQFHATLSYEDFVRGWRPAGNGNLKLCDGPFLELVKKATERCDDVFVMVIEEINRGNPAQIFGELLTLLEDDKRTPDEALHLCHQEEGNSQPIYIPGNLHVIGTMNIADRSLALVDFALRRRFAFVTLAPCFGQSWFNWMTRDDKAALLPEFAHLVAEKMHSLNERIAQDAVLGHAYSVGHSYVTSDKRIRHPHKWFHAVIETELEPLLREYWFDKPEEVKGAVTALKAGIAP